MSSVDRAAPGQRLLHLWRRLQRLPGGRWLFDRALFRLVPYSGSTGARVVTLEPGHARVELRDRRAVRNHLRSLHAVALANIAELTSGLAMLTAIPPHLRGIVLRIDTSYLKKARGTVTAESRPILPAHVEGETDVDVVAEVRDQAGDVVSRTTVTWRLGER